MGELKTSANELLMMHKSQLPTSLASQDGKKVHGQALMKALKVQ